MDKPPGNSQKLTLFKRAVWWSNRADCTRIPDKRARISRAYSYRSPRRRDTRDSNRFRIPRWSSTALGGRAIAPPGARVLCWRDTPRIRRRCGADRPYRNRSAPSSIPASRTVSIVSCNLKIKRKLRARNTWAQSSPFLRPRINSAKKKNDNKSPRENPLTSRLTWLLNKMSLFSCLRWLIYKK